MAKKEKAISLGTHPEPFNKGTLSKSSSDKVASGHIDAIQSSELPNSSSTLQLTKLSQILINSASFVKSA